MNSRATTLLQCLNDGRCDPRQWFSAFIYPNVGKIFLKIQNKYIFLRGELGLISAPKLWNEGPVSTSIENKLLWNKGYFP